MGGAEEPEQLGLLSEMEFVRDTGQTPTRHADARPVNTATRFASW